jgi:hypothetical protein
MKSFSKRSDANSSDNGKQRPLGRAFYSAIPAIVRIGDDGIWETVG